MTFQSQSNAYVCYKVQSALGSPESGSGASILRTAGGQGGRLTKAAVESAEVRRDGMRSRGRHGSQRTAGSYDTEYSPGNIDPILEAIMRGTYANALTVTQSTKTSVTTTTHAIIAAAGDFVADGYKVGDVVQATGLPDAANNSIPIRLTGVTTLQLQTAETLVVNASPDTTFSISRVGTKLINPAAGSLVKRYFSVEEYEVDIDGSEFFSDCVWGAITFSMAPDRMLMANPSWVGTGTFSEQSDSSAPILTGPTETTADPFSVIDATVRWKSPESGATKDLGVLTAFDLTIDTVPASPPVVSSKIGPDVFTGNMSVSMNLTMMREDLVKVTEFRQEDSLLLSILAQRGSNFFSIVVPYFTLGGVDKSALANAGGPRTQTISVPAALIGKDPTGGVYDATMIKFQSL